MSRAFTEVAPGVFVATSTLDVTTSTVLVHGTSALVVDPNWTPAELEATADWFAMRGLTVTGGFATHAHHDHVLWHPAFGDVPRWASTITADRATTHRAELVAALGTFPAPLADLVGRLTPFDGDVLPLPAEVTLIRHQAHTPGHTALWLPGPRVLIAGDMLSDVEPPLPEETGLAEYRAGLAILRPYVEQAALVIPGHGHPGRDAVRRWDTDLARLDLIG